MADAMTDGMTGTNRRTRGQVSSRAWPAVALLAAAATTGCVAGPTMTSTTSPTSLTSPATRVPPGIGGSSLPVMQPAARVESRDGALAYVGYYLAQVNAGARRADATPAVALATQGCDGCREVAADIAKRTADGIGLTADYWTFVRGSLHSRRGHLWLMLVSVHRPGGETRVLFTLEFDGTWRVAELQVQ